MQHFTIFKITHLILIKINKTYNQFIIYKTESSNLKNIGAFSKFIPNIRRNGLVFPKISFTFIRTNKNLEYDLRKHLMELWYLTDSR